MRSRSGPQALDDAPTEIAISLMTPYFAYLPAEALGVSAVLAAVTAGLYLGWRSPELITPVTRIQAFSFWEMFVFVLNAALFVLVGLELPHVIDGLGGSYSTGELSSTAAVVARGDRGALPVGLPARVPARSHVRADARQRAPATVACCCGRVDRHARRRCRWRPRWRSRCDRRRRRAPGRDLIIFLAYAVILVTVVIQGLALPG